MKFYNTLIISLLFTSFAIADNPNLTFDDWDTDNDGLIEKHEFSQTFIENYYDAWDPEGKQGIVEPGFFKKSYAGLDSDNDNILSDEEWMLGYNYFYDNFIVNDQMTYIDVNADGKVTYKEYYNVLYDTPFYSSVDTDHDNYISEHELAEYCFNNWDFNNSGTISEAEYSRFDWYYLDV